MNDEKSDVVETMANDKSVAEIPETSGFDESKPNGLGSPLQVDALQEIVDNPDMPIAMRVMAHRALLVERNTHDALRMGQAVVQTQERVDHLERLAQHLTSQQSLAEMQMERQTRSVALDLAIKALPDALKGSSSASDVITGLAEAFLGWMKAGAH